MADGWDGELEKVVKLALSDEEVERIVGFLGYGRPEADVWFIGKEEGIAGRDDSDVLYKLKARGQFEETIDLYEAHLDLHEDGQPIDLALKIPNTPVWRYEAKIMLAIAGEREWRDKALFRHYIQQKLGRKSSVGNTFMTELAPIPSKSTFDRRWREALLARCPDLERKIEDREIRLRELYTKLRPQLVICYSLPAAEQFANLLGIRWWPLTHQIFTSEDHKRIMVPFLGVGHFGNKTVTELQSHSLLTLA